MPIQLEVFTLVGYAIFRAVNDQKDKFRKDPTKPIWGSTPKYIKATFQVKA
jgi:hypothetical protein